MAPACGALPFPKTGLDCAPFHLTTPMLLKTVFQKLFKMRERTARLRPGADEGYDAYEKPFLDHLEDLRTTLIKIAATLLISTAVCFIFNKQIFELVQLPAKSPLADVAEGVSLYEKLDFFMLSPTELIFLMFKLAFYCGLILTFPFTVFFLFQFLIPGLREAEKRAIIPGVGVGFVLFLVGGGFAFFVATPFALKFFYQFENERLSATDPTTLAMSRPITEFALVGIDGERIPPYKKSSSLGAEEEKEASSPLTPELRSEIRSYMQGLLATAEGANVALRYDKDRDKLVIVPTKAGKSSYQIGRYISFISQLVLVFGISFQMPIVVTILVKLDLLTASVMRNTRSYAWVIICVAAGILTPSPDAFTMGLLAVPLIILYELCIIIAVLLERARARRIQAEEEAERRRWEQLRLKPASELSEEEKAELHRAEIEQYEREHAHLYQDESAHEDLEPLGDPADADPSNYDESWHEGQETWPSSLQPGMESDHAEPVDLHPGEGDAPDEEEAPEDTTASEVSETAESPGADDPALDEASREANCEPGGPIVDLNHASLEELLTLPGVDSQLAETLMACRPFETYDDLERVPGLTTDIIIRITERSMLG